MTAYLDGTAGPSRGRGEQPGPASRRARVPGPSPRARGVVAAPGKVLPGLGAIPAYTGSSCAPGRGEQASAGPSTSSRSGPSPRAREQLDTRLFQSLSSGPSPRMRGAGQPGLVVSAREGPSPRVRGAGRRGVLHGQPGGSIPAGAGSRAAVPWRPWPGRVHLRVRGEQDALPIAYPATADPSPRARGADRGPVCGDCLGGAIPACVESSRPINQPRPDGRSIPACAESSRYDFFTSSPSREHPRGRGEQRRGQLAHRSECGLSPACAGSRCRCTDGARLRRIHPPAPGKQFPDSRGRAEPRAHPRGRREQSRSGLTGRMLSGPSPRARGSSCARCAGPRASRVHPCRCGEQPTVASGTVAHQGPSPQGGEQSASASS